MSAVFRLLPRLTAVADLVPDGARLVDVGTDHGRLPVSLLLSGRIESAIAADIRPGPLSAAQRTADAYDLEDRLKFVLCDGLEGISASEVNTVVIAGMGGETIAGILSRAPWTTQDGCLVLLQPMSKSEELRLELPQLGFKAVAERLVRDNGRLYQLMAVIGGTESTLSEAELYTGRWELIREDPLFPEYLSGLISRMEHAMHGLDGASSPEHAKRAERFREALDGFYGMWNALKQNGRI